MTLPGHAQTPSLAPALGLLLRARMVVRGLALGARRGDRRGSGAEFLEHAPYTPGADVRRIDPLASSRHDRLLVRTWREDARRTVHVLLDRSPSMALAPRGDHLSRWDAARVAALASCLASLRSGDPWTLWTFSDHGPEPLVSSGASVSRAALALESLIPATKGEHTALDRALRGLAPHLRRGDAVVVLTDLFSLDASPLDALRALRARRHPVTLLHLLCAEDRELPEGAVKLVPVEGGAPLVLDGRVTREAHRRALDAWADGWREALSGVGVRSVRLDADQPLAPPLARALLGRG